MKRTLALAAAVLVLILVAAGAGFGWHVWRASQQAFPADLAGALFLANGTLYSHARSGFVAVDTGGAKVTDAARAGSHLAYLTDSGTGAYGVLVDKKPLDSSSATKLQIALSPGGKRVAYAEHVIPVNYASSTPAAASSTNPTAAVNWHVVVKDVATGETHTYPSAFSPYFLSDDQLVYFTAGGLYYADVAHATTTLLNSQAYPDVTMVTAYSPEAHSLLWVGPTNGVPVILTLGDTVPPSLTLAYRLPIEPATTFALTPTAVYELHADPSSTVILKRTTQDHTPAHVLTMPAGMKLAKLIL